MTFLKLNDQGKNRYLNLDTVVLVEQTNDQMYKFYLLNGTRIDILLQDDTNIGDVLGEIKSFLKEDN